MQTTTLIDAIHASAWEGVLAITGGGSGAISQLLSQPGASKTILDATVPYSQLALQEWIGQSPEQACSETTARQMAMASFCRAKHLDSAVTKDQETKEPGGNDRLFGIGATASLASVPKKRGEHRLHVAVQTATQTSCLSLLFQKEKRTRQEEETVSEHAILTLLAQTCGVHTLDLTKTPTGITPSLATCDAEPAWSQLLNARLSYSLIQPDSPGTQKTDNLPKLIFPGSFNPLHEGHCEMVRLAEETTGLTAWYELSIKNVDKPQLDFIEISRRLESLGDVPVVLTNAATFVEKATLFPGCQFIVGADTLLRIASPKYYGQSRTPKAKEDKTLSNRDESLNNIRATGCRFLAYGREVQGSFLGSDALNLPKTLLDMTDTVSNEDFRCDLSSTKLRKTAELDK